MNMTQSTLASNTLEVKKRNKMFGEVAKIYLTPHKTHVWDGNRSGYSYCGRLLSGVAWNIKACYLHHVERPVCKSCLRMFISKGK